MMEGLVTFKIYEYKCTVDSFVSIVHNYHCLIIRVIFVAITSCQEAVLYILKPLSQKDFYLRHIQLLHCLCLYTIKFQGLDFHLAFLHYGLRLLSKSSIGLSAQV